MALRKALGTETVCLAHNRSFPSPIQHFGAVSSAFLLPACPLPPAPSGLHTPLAVPARWTEVVLFFPPLPLVIPELRAQPTGPGGGCVTVPHASHDVAGCPQCGAQGRVRCCCLPGAR